MESRSKTQPVRLGLRLKEAADALGLSERKFREIQHTVPHVDLGGVRIFPVDALRAWLTAQARTHEAEVDTLVEEALRSVRRPPTVGRDRGVPDLDDDDELLAG